jgi:Tfp pilus assembly protein PilN
LKLPAKALGIEFADARVHFAEMQRTFGEARLQATHTLDLTGVTGEDEVAERMTAFLAEHRLRSRRVVVGIPLSDPMIRLVRFPGVDDKHLRQMLEFELDRHFPLAAADAYFDFQILQRIDDQVLVLIVAIERRILDRYHRLITNAGLPTSTITPAILADIHLPQVAALPPGQTIGLLRHQPASAEVAILTEESVISIHRFPRTETNGNGNGNGKETSATAKFLHAALRQSCLHTAGIPSPEGVLLSGRPLDGDLANELRALLDLEALVPIGDQLGLPVEGAHYATAIGLALQGLTSQSELPNLLPEELRSSESGLGAFAIGAQIGLAALLVTALLAGNVVQKRRQLSGFEAALAELKPEVERVKGMKADLKQQKKFIESFDQAAGGQDVSPLEVLRAITRETTRTTWVTDLSIDGTKIKISGRAKKNDDLQQLKIFLGGHPLFTDVSECSQTQNRDGYWQFKLCATLVTAEETGE